MPDDKDFELDDLDSFSFDELSLDDESSQALEAQDGEDKYGVWVKGAPEDLDEAQVDPAPTDGGLPEEDFLSSEELAKLDDQFDFVTVSDEPLEGETLETDLSDEGLDSLNLPDLEDFDSAPSSPGAAASEELSDLPDEFGEAPAAPAAPQDDLEALPENNFDEISLDDFVSFEEATDAPGASNPIESVDDLISKPTEEDESEFNEEFLDIDIEIEDEIGDEDLEVLEGAQVVREEPFDTTPVAGAEEIDLSEFADFEDESPATDVQDVGATEIHLEDEVAFDDLPAPSSDLEEDLADAPAADSLPASDDFAADLSVADLTLESLSSEHPSIDLEPEDEMDMDHIIALEEDLTSGIRPSSAPQSVASEPSFETPAANVDAASAILSKIEKELSSIKQEITDLKKEVTSLRAPGDPISIPAPSAAKDDKPHGFFDEEDDETIALTGDELDNILSTAEINEEEEVGETLDDDAFALPETPENIIETDAEGEIVESAAPVYVSDEEFLSGTELADPEFEEQIPPSAEATPVPGGAWDSSAPASIALDDEIEADADAFSDFSDDSVQTSGELGIPSSIELEETLPESIEEDATEDLLASDEIPPLPEGVMEAESAVLDIPFDEEISLDDEPISTDAPELPASAASLDSTDASDPWDQEIEEFHMPEPEAAPITTPAQQPNAATSAPSAPGISSGMKEELKSVLAYMDKLLASLPDDKIQEFAESEHFEVYKRLFEELGLIE